MPFKGPDTGQLLRGRSTTCGCCIRQNKNHKVLVLFLPSQFLGLAAEACISFGLTHHIRGKTEILQLLLVSRNTEGELGTEKEK